MLLNDAPFGYSVILVPVGFFPFFSGNFSKSKYSDEIKYILTPSE